MRRRIRRRRATAAVVVLLALGAIAVVVTSGGGSSGHGTSARSPGPVTLQFGGRTLATVPARQVESFATGAAALPIGSTEVVSRGPAQITYRVDRPALLRRLAATSGGALTVPAEPVASRVQAPIVQQAYPRNCETASLSMLLATVHPMIDQRTLQRELPHAQPISPTNGPGGQVWGDPEQGFVGLPINGGSSGGYGVYERPILRLASRVSKPVDLTGLQPSAIYDRLLQGHAVMVWVGLSDGPYASWHTPQGSLVRANWGEHAVLLTGVRANEVLVNDPLDGRRKVWSKSAFRQMWDRLGRRAVSV